MASFAGAARARILWLEDIIRSRLPDVDLESGPKVEVLPGPRGDGGSEETSDTAASAAGQSQEISQAENAPVGQRAALKRPLNAGTSPDEAGAFPEQAHSVAVNLGMLSLHSDSQQKHYLGSSSGLLFTHLVGASPSSSGSPAPGIEAPSSRADWDPSSVALGSQRRYYRSLHRFLRQVRHPERRSRPQNESNKSPGTAEKGRCRCSGSDVPALGAPGIPRARSRVSLRCFGVRLLHLLLPAGR